MKAGSKCLLLQEKKQPLHDLCSPGWWGAPCEHQQSRLLSCPASAPTLPQVQHKKAAPNPRSCPSLRSSWGKGERTQCWEPIHFTHLAHNTHIVRSLAAQTSSRGGKAMLMADALPWLQLCHCLPFRDTVFGVIQQPAGSSAAVGWPRFCHRAC